VADQIHFSSDGTIHSMDGQVLNRSVNPATAVPDGQAVNSQTRVGTLATYNTGAGPATQRVNVTQVQPQAPTRLVKVAGYDVKPEVAEKMKETSPHLFIEPEAKAAEEAKAALAADKAREDEAKGTELGRHADDNLESYHQHLVGEVFQRNLIGLMVYGQKNETPPADLLKTIAQDMGEPLDRAIDKVNAVIGGVHRQFNNLATAFGVNPEKAAVWLKEHRNGTAMVVSQAHLMRRDVRGWLPLLEDYRAATGDGRKHLCSYPQPPQPDAARSNSSSRQGWRLSTRRLMCW
jgi:hypothetical protein